MSLRLFALVAALLWLGVLGCTEAPVTVPLRSLERSGDVAFVCRGADGSGRDINACPDFENEESPNHLLALVTQTIRGEVAVVDISAGGVVDLDHATPGYDFLPIGAQPVDIVSTPDGAVTFVGVGEPGMQGIFAIPTTCIEAPPPDITTWPSCALPAAPGDMALVPDPFPQFGCDPRPDPEPPAGSDCPGVNLTERRKLLVSLPELHAIAIIDTHELAAMPQGAFAECPARYVELDVNLPAGDVPQDIPPDLEGGCVPPELNHGPVQTSFEAQPGGFALADSTLYIADRAAPLIHTLDVSNPCEPKQLPPLLPKSFEAPGRTVTTRRVAASPVTSKGERFVYAIDELEGSVMVFDVSPGSTQRTPLVRSGTRRLPFEPADRIAFTAPAQDLTFALRDVPIVDEVTGVATIGTYCAPTGDSLGAQYRTSQDYSRGASPRELRGVFGFVALTSGQVMVIDVEDFDAPCRRPVSSNSDAAEDFRGCENDPQTPDEYVDENGQRTVSGEASCEIVQPHRARSGSFVVTSQDLGVHAPSLRNLPQLQAAAGGTLPTGPDEEGRLSPKLLAVDFVNPEGGTTPAQVYVGTSLYEATEGADNELVIDPATAERPSVALLMNQPRAFAPEEEYTLTYEGAFVGERPTGAPNFGIQEPSVIGDADASFCSRGVQDVALAREMGPELGVDPTDSKALDAFARRHADYVQITSELAAKDDDEWDKASCVGELGSAAFFACKNLFGTKDTPNEQRDLRILEAYQNRLVVEPRAYGSEAEKNALLEALYCCFGRGKVLEYKVRAGHQWVLVGAGGIGFRNDVIADPTQDLRCIRDCNPRRSLLHSRAFEISSSACQEPAENDPPPDCAIGYATEADLACVIDNQSPVSPGSVSPGCIFENLTHRFAVYRGNQPTLRDTAFAWQIAGGFVTLGANLAAQTAAVSPQSLVFVPQLGQLAVVDGAAEGLVLVSLDSVAVSRLFF